MRMLYLSAIITFFLLFGLVPSSKADVGCALNYGNSSSEIIYFTVIGKDGGPNNDRFDNYGGSPTYNNVGFPNACPRYVYNTALEIVGGRCCVNGNCNNTTKTEVNFTPVPCPIDDYIPLLIIATGGLGFLYIRKTSLLKII